MKMQTWFGGVLLVIMALLSGCATTQFSGYKSASKEDLVTAQNGGYVPAAMAQIAVFQNPFINNGLISPKAMKMIQELAISCQWQADAQLAGPLQSTLNGAVPYGLSGGASGPAARWSFGAAADMGRYALLGGVSLFASGGVNGAISGSYSMAGVKGTCTKDFWEQMVHTDADFDGTIVEVVFSGKRVGNDMPPAYHPPKEAEPQPLPANPYQR